MSNSKNTQIVTLAYLDERFQFDVKERTEDILRGHFLWTDDEKAHLLTLLEQEDDEGNQPWYLDDDGYRLTDEKLFQMSPWSIIEGTRHKKAVQRFMDQNSGEAWFCFTPWFRIGDEFNRRSTE